MNKEDFAWEQLKTEAVQGYSLVSVYEREGMKFSKYAKTRGCLDAYCYSDNHDLLVVE